MGGLFLVGIFMPRVKGTAAIVGTLGGLCVSVLIGYFDEKGSSFASRIRHE